MFKIGNIASPTSGEPVKNQFFLETDKYIAMQSYDTPIMKISRYLNKSGDFTIYVNGDPWGYSMTTSKYVNRFLYDYTGINKDLFREAIKHHTHTFKDRLITYKIIYKSELTI